VASLRPLLVSISAYLEPVAFIVVWCGLVRKERGPRRAPPIAPWHGP
jgi:hypothetical protein